MALCLVGLAASGTGWAQWNASATQSFSYVDNVSRAAPGLEEGDLEQTTSVNGNLNLHQARHQVLLSLNAAHHGFRSRSDANNTSGNGALVWSWSAAGGVSGQLSATRARSRYLYSGGLDVAGSAEQNSRGLSGQVRLGEAGPWSLTVSGQQSQGWYSLAALNAQASDQHSSSVSLGRRLGTLGGLQWVTSRSVSESPHALQSGVVPQSEVHSSQLALSWTITPRTSGSLSIGRSRSRQNTSDNNGTSTVGSASLNWQPSAKTGATLSWQRDIGAQRNTLSVLQNTDPNDPTQVRLIESGIVNESLQRTASALLRWSVATRTQLSLSASRTRAGSTTLMDDLGVIRLGATRTQTQSLSWTQGLGQHWQLACSHARSQVEVLSTGDNHPVRVQTTACSLTLSLN